MPPKLILGLALWICLCLSPMFYTVSKGVADSATEQKWRKQQWLGERLDSQCHATEEDCAPYREFLIRLRKEIGE